MAKTISIFKSLTRISAGALTYGANSGGARIFEGLFIDHTLDANNNAMSRYQASGRIVQIALQGNKSASANTMQVAVRQGSAAGPIGTLWDMSAAAPTGTFGATSAAANMGLILRPMTSREPLRQGVVALPSNGIAFNVNTDAQSPDAEDLYIFVSQTGETGATIPVRIDVELDDSGGRLKPHKRARFLGTSSGAMH